MFYQPDLTLSHLTQEESHHALHVLRMRAGDKIELTDGKGTLASAELTSDDKRKAGFKITSTNKVPRRQVSIHLAVAPTKNVDRMEWLVEKVTEIGVDKITFVRCKTSERSSVPMERLLKHAVSAMKQSRQAWLPELVDMTPFKDFLDTVTESQRFIAYVDTTNPDHLSKAVKAKGDCLLLVGPEGDFTSEELDLATSGGFKKVSLGPNRLRTETAGVYGIAVISAVR
jgi:16S rRNA (uracil1498-N3)-methyltransferase